jgi:hypothetical protein
MPKGQKLYKHGFWKNYRKLYGVWKNIKNRCVNSKNPGYKNYGGRGIKICDEWINSVENFCNWALINGYKEGLEIDRIDNNGDYCPVNCRWVTKKINNRNKSNNAVITVNEEIKCIMEWAEILNMNHGTISGWLHRYGEQYAINRIEEIINTNKFSPRKFGHFVYLEIDGEIDCLSGWARRIGKYPGIISYWIKIKDKEYAIGKIKEILYNLLIKPTG